MAANRNTQRSQRHFPGLLAFLAILICATSASANAGLYLDADGRTDSYLLIWEAFGGNSYEVPDCAHSSFGPHITQRYDSELEEPVFAFHVHKEFDNDRCIVFDRQRTEITTFRSKARKDDIRVYQWRFKLDENFIPSTTFNHIFQIRPIDPVPGGNPVFTISTRSGETEELLLYQDKGSGMRVLHRMPLADFKGLWIDARVRAKFSPSGFIEVQLKSTLGDVVLLEWRQDSINLWPWDGIQFTLPKWGNYRSLENTRPLRDEIVLYNDFCVAEEGESCEKLEMLDKLNIQVTPAAFQFPTEFSIDPFPSDQPILGNGILRTPDRPTSATDNAPLTSRQPSTESSTDESDVNEGTAPLLPPFIKCQPISNWTHPTNPFVKAPGCAIPSSKFRRNKLERDYQLHNDRSEVIPPK